MGVEVVVFGFVVVGDIGHIEELDRSEEDEEESESKQKIGKETFHIGVGGCGVICGGFVRGVFGLFFWMFLGWLVGCSFLCGIGGGIDSRVDGGEEDSGEAVPREKGCAGEGALLNSGKGKGGKGVIGCVRYIAQGRQRSDKGGIGREDMLYRSGEGGGIERRNGESCVANDLGKGRGIGGDNGAAAAHSLQRRKAEALVKGRIDKDTGAGIEPTQRLVGDIARREDVSGEVAMDSGKGGVEVGCFPALCSHQEEAGKGCAMAAEEGVVSGDDRGDIFAVLQGTDREDKRRIGRKVLQSWDSAEAGESVLECGGVCLWVCVGGLVCCGWGLWGLLLWVGFLGCGWVCCGLLCGYGAKERGEVGDMDTLGAEVGTERKEVAAGRGRDAEDMVFVGIGRGDDSTECGLVGGVREPVGLQEGDEVVDDNSGGDMAVVYPLGDRVIGGDIVQVGGREGERLFRAEGCDKAVVAPKEVFSGFV